MFANPKSAAAKELVRLDKVVVEWRRALRDLEQEHRKTQAQAKAAKEKLTEAHAAQKPTEKLDAQYAEIRNRLRDHWPPRLEGAHRALDRAVADRERHMSSNFEELAAEMLPFCLQAAEDVQEAIDTLEVAVQRWRSEAQRFESVMKLVPGVRGLEMPSLRVGDLESALAQIDGNVPVPMPRQLVPSEPAADDEQEAEEAA